jgi:alcohol dehydrogenase class IV
MISTMLSGTARTSLRESRRPPARAPWPGERSSGGVTADPDTLKCASPAARQSRARAARLLTGQPTASIQDGLAWIRQTLTLLAVPRLATSAVRPQHTDEIAAKARTSSSMHGNPVALSHDDLKAALLQAL